MDFFGKIPAILWEIIAGVIFNVIAIAIIVFLVDNILYQITFFSLLGLIDIATIIALIKYSSGGSI